MADQREAIASRQNSPGRWLQFRLHTLLFGAVLLSIPCGYIAHELLIVRDREKPAFAGRGSRRRLPRFQMDQ